jgi:hypothetical protein
LFYKPQNQIKSINFTDAQFTIFSEILNRKIIYVVNNHPIKYYPEFSWNYFASKFKV